MEVSLSSETLVNIYQIPQLSILQDQILPDTPWLAAKISTGRFLDVKRGRSVRLTT
jgi:hypothetical protein